MTFSLCIVSGKGGVGKTTVSAGLSKILAAEHRVLAVDADVECPNLNLLLGGGTAGTEKVRDVFSTLPEIDEARCIKCGKCVEACRRNALFRRKDDVPLLLEEQCNGCKACFLVCPAGAIRERKVVVGEIMKGAFMNHKLVLLAGELEVGQEEPTPVVRELMKDVERVKHDFDFVVVDAAPGVKCNVAAALEHCDHALIVVEPTPFGVEDAKRVAELVESMGKDAHIIINRAVKVEKDQRKVASRLPFPVMCVIPYSLEAVALSVEGRAEKIEGMNQLAKMVEKLAKKVKAE